MASGGWIDEWARGIASSEARRVHARVRGAMLEGRAMGDVLAEVRYGFSRLTPGQREHVVLAIGAGADAAGSR